MSNDAAPNPGASAAFARPQDRRPPNPEALGLPAPRARRSLAGALDAAASPHAERVVESHREARAALRRGSPQSVAQFRGELDYLIELLSSAAKGQLPSGAIPVPDRYVGRARHAMVLDGGAFARGQSFPSSLNKDLAALELLIRAHPDDPDAGKARKLRELVDQARALTQGRAMASDAIEPDPQRPRSPHPEDPKRRKIEAATGLLFQAASGQLPTNSQAVRAAARQAGLARGVLSGKGILSSQVHASEDALNQDALTFSRWTAALEAQFPQSRTMASFRQAADAALRAHLDRHGQPLPPVREVEQAAPVQAGVWVTLGETPTATVSASALIQAMHRLQAAAQRHEGANFVQVARDARISTDDRQILLLGMLIGHDGRLREHVDPRALASCGLTPQEIANVVAVSRTPAQAEVHAPTLPGQAARPRGV